MSVRASTADRVDDAVLCLINAERRKHGLRPLKGNARLRRAADRHSGDMVSRHYFAHQSPSGGDVVSRARAARYITPRKAWQVAENIAWGSGRLGTPSAIVEAWMNSAGHRANILDGGLREAGVGVSARTPSGDGGGTYTMVFGRRG
jgi:uncharacterized protein YkwD